MANIAEPEPEPGAAALAEREGGAVTRGGPDAAAPRDVNPEEKMDRVPIVQNAEAADEQKEGVRDRNAAQRAVGQPPRNAGNQRLDNQQPADLAVHEGAAADHGQRAQNREGHEPLRLSQTVIYKLLLLAVPVVVALSMRPPSVSAQLWDEWKKWIPGTDVPDKHASPSGTAKEGGGDDSGIPFTAKPVKLQCPRQQCDKMEWEKCFIYVPANTKLFQIDASDPSIVNAGALGYEWDSLDYGAVSGEKSPMLSFHDLQEVGEYDVDLQITFQMTDSDGHTALPPLRADCSYRLIVHEAPVLGIDLGTTYSCIGYQTPTKDPVSNRRDTMIVHADRNMQERCIPTAIYFPPNGGQILIGYEAKRMLQHDPQNVIFDVKRIIGRRFDDPEIERFRKEHAFTLTEDAYPQIVIPNREHSSIRPEQALAAVLAYLVKTASEEFGVPYIRDVVVSTPAIFHDSQRRAVRCACTLAGLHVRQLEVEPSSAAISHIYHYDVKRYGEFNKLFMTFDFGGGTLDVSVLRCNRLICDVFGVAGNDALGGIDFDNAIGRILKRKLAGKYVIDEEVEALIAAKSESIKKTLTEETSAMVRLLIDGYPVDVTITREEFETESEPLLQAAMDTAKEALLDPRFQDEKSKATNIRAVLMIGGSCKMPMIRKRLQRELNIIRERLQENARRSHDPNYVVKPIQLMFFGKDQETEENVVVFPDEDAQLMVVKGTAVLGGVMAFSPLEDATAADLDQKHTVDGEPSITDVLPMDLGFEVCMVDPTQEDGRSCHVMDVLIHKNSPYPIRNHSVYCQKEPDGTLATLNLYEGDSDDVRKNVFIGKLEIFDVPPRTKDQCGNIRVDLILDADGVAQIEAKTYDRSNSNVPTNVYNTSLPVKTNNGSLCAEDVQELRNEILSWFSRDIQRVIIKAFESSVCVQ